MANGTLGMGVFGFSVAESDEYISGIIRRLQRRDVICHSTKGFAGRRLNPGL